MKTDIEVTDEMLTAAMRAFEPMSSVLRYREKDKWHSCDMMAMRDAIRAALAVMPKHKVKPRFIRQHYLGIASGGPWDGCEIDSDGPTIPDEAGGAYNYAGGRWVWIPGLGTQLNAALSRS